MLGAIAGFFACFALFSIALWWATRGLFPIKGPKP